MSDAAIGQVFRLPRTGSDRVARDAPLVPCLLLAALLFAVGILAGWQINGRSERALLHVAYGSAGMPVVLAWSADACRTADNMSAGRLGRADLLALLESR